MWKKQRENERERRDRRRGINHIYRDFLREENSLVLQLPVETGSLLGRPDGSKHNPKWSIFLSGTKCKMLQFELCISRDLVHYCENCEDS